MSRADRQAGGEFGADPGVDGGVRAKTGPIFTRRSRWVYANQGRSPAIAKRPPARLSHTEV